MKDNKIKILESPIEELRLSEKCKTYLRAFGFKSLTEVVQQGWAGLRESNNFDYISFNEIISLLNSFDLVYLMENSD
jgi:DNA-directed RNA polymerase alpha subunit